MKYHQLLLLLPMLMPLLLTACGGGGTSPITPAADRLTFIFFYIDG